MGREQLTKEIGDASHLFSNLLRSFVLGATQQLVTQMDLNSSSLRIHRFLASNSEDDPFGTLSSNDYSAPSTVDRLFTGRAGYQTQPYYLHFLPPIRLEATTPTPTSRNPADYTKQVHGELIRRKLLTSRNQTIRLVRCVRNDSPDSHRQQWTCDFLTHDTHEVKMYTFQFDTNTGKVANVGNNSVTLQ